MVILLLKMDGTNIKSNQTLKVKMKILKCKGQKLQQSQTLKVL